MLRLIILICSLMSSTLFAEVKISDATVRLLPPGVPNTAAYFSLENHFDTQLVLVGAVTDIANKAEIHNHIMKNGMMSMQQQSEVVIAPGESIRFAPGGLHIMLFDLKQPLYENQAVTITLLTKQDKFITITAKVAQPTAHKHH